MQRPAAEPRFCRADADEIEKSFGNLAVLEYLTTQNKRNSCFVKKKVLRMPADSGGGMDLKGKPP